MFFTKEQFSFINNLLEVKYHEKSEQGFMARVFSLAERSNALGIYQKIHKNVTEDGKMFIDGEVEFSLGEVKVLEDIMKEPMPLSASRMAEDIVSVLNGKESLPTNA